MKCASLYPLFLLLSLFTFVSALPVDVQGVRPGAEFQVRDVVPEYSQRELSPLEKRDIAALTYLFTTLNTTGTGVTLVKGAISVSLTEQQIIKFIANLIEQKNLTYLLEVADQSGLGLDIVLLVLTHYETIPGLTKIINLYKGNSNSTSSSSSSSSSSGGILGTLLSGVTSTISSIFGLGSTSTSTSTSTGTSTSSTSSSTGTSTSTSSSGGILGSILSGVGSLFGLTSSSSSTSTTSASASAAATATATSAAATATSTATSTSSSGVLGSILSGVGSLFGLSGSSSSASTTSTVAASTATAVVGTATSLTGTTTALVATTTTAAAVTTSKTSTLTTATSTSTDVILSVLSGVTSVISSIFKREDLTAEELAEEIEALFKREDIDNGLLLQELVARMDDESLDAYDKRDLLDTIYSQIIGIIGTNSNIELIAESLQKSGLGINVIYNALVDSGFYNFDVDLVRYLVTNKIITLSSLFLALLNSGLLLSVVGDIIGNTTYIKLVLNFVLAIFNGTIDIWALISALF